MTTTSESQGELQRVLDSVAALDEGATAERLGIPLSQVRVLVSEGRLPCRVSGLHRWIALEAIELLEADRRLIGRADA